jgi:hypothetical protein
VRCSSPTAIRIAEVWWRVVGDEFLFVGDVAGGGLVEIVRHELSTSDCLRIVDEHYPQSSRRQAINPVRPARLEVLSRTRPR